MRAQTIQRLGVSACGEAAFPALHRAQNKYHRTGFVGHGVGARKMVLEFKSQFFFYGKGKQPENAMGEK